MTTIARLYKDAELDIIGEINERLPKICDFTKINIQSVSNGKGTPYIKIDDVTKINPPRSWAIVRLDPFGEFVDANGYDVFGNSALASTIINLINNTPNGYTICIATNDEPSTNSINLRNLLSTFGFNILNYNWVYRCAWLGVFQKGANSILSEKYIDSGIVNDEILIPKVVNFPMDGTTKSIQGIDCIHDNCNLTNDGIYVEEGTTNLITDLSGIHGYPSDTVGILQPDGFFKFNVSSDNNEILQSSNRIVKASTTYTESFLFKTDSTNVVDGIFNITFFTDKHNEVPVTIQKLGYNLYKASASYTTLSPARIRALDINNTNNLNGTYISIRDAQLEEKPYATSFVQGTRPNSNNGVQIPTSFLKFPFSVTMEVIPDIKNGIKSIYGSEPSYMYVAGLWTNIGGYKGEIHQIHRDTIVNGIENGFRYTIVFRTSGYDIYMNNTKIVNNNSYYSGVFDLNTVSYFTIGCRGYESIFGYANALYRNIAFYNRELTQDDVNKLCNSKFSMSKYGGINGQTLIEKQNLLTGTKNFTGWTSDNSNNILDSSMIFNGLIPSKVIGAWTYYSQNFNFEQNKTYTLSAWVRTNIDNKINVGLFSFVSYGQGHYIIPKANKWYKWSYSFTIDGVDGHTAGIKAVRVETGDATSTNPLWVCGIKLMEGNTNKMSITKEEMIINELLEGSVL